MSNTVPLGIGLRRFATKLSPGLKSKAVQKRRLPSRSITPTTHRRRHDHQASARGPNLAFERKDELRRPSLKSWNLLCGAPKFSDQTPALNF